MEGSIFWSQRCAAVGVLPAAPTFGSGAAFTSVSSSPRSFCSFSFCSLSFRFCSARRAAREEETEVAGDDEAGGTLAGAAAAVAGVACGRAGDVADFFATAGGSADGRVLGDAPLVAEGRGRAAVGEDAAVGMVVGSARAGALPDAFAGGGWRARKEYIQRTSDGYDNVCVCRCGGSDSISSVPACAVTELVKQRRDLQ